jgi:hypothetical protein
MELTVASGVSIVVVLSILGLLNSHFKASTEAEKANEGWLEAASGSSDLIAMISGASRMNPPEDLAAAKDGLYMGLTDLSPAQSPALCRNTPDFNVFRVTTPVTRQKAERLLRLWSTTSVGSTGSGDELRLTYDAGSSFADPITAPKELYIVDADGNWRRRFTVRRFEVRNTSLDPYDDKPKTDASGNPVAFQYVSVFLDRPLMPGGSASSVPALSFLTSSIAIPVRTWDVCVSQEGQVVKVNEESGASPQLMMKLTDGLMKAVKFKVEFANSLRDGRLDQLTFYKGLAAESSRDCFSVLNFTIEAEPSVRLKRSILVANFMSLRPLSCP